MLQIEKPKITPNESEDLYEAKFVVEPLRKGFGLTIGNAMRRTLLSALPGIAPKAIRISGVQHEFSTIKGVKEDVIDIVLNIKTPFSQLISAVGSRQTQLSSIFTNVAFSLSQ